MHQYCRPIPSLALFRRKRLAGLVFPMLLLSGCQSTQTVQNSSLPEPGLTTKTTASSKKTSKTVVKKEASEVTPSSEQSITVTTDLWQRLQKGMDIDISSSNRRIQSELKWYKNNQHYFNLVADRAGPYLYFIIEEAEARDLPLELALLPVVESAFDPFAYSHAGASGLWQIMPTTGEYFGLDQNWWYDGRRDVVAATRIALDYMEDLYDRFDDWELALAAYNSGPGRVQRAVNKNAKQGKPTQFWHLDLPNETTAYVPKLLALSAVIKHPEKYGIRLPAIDNTPYFETVNIGGQLDMAKAAKLAGIPLNDLYKLNPGLNRWSTPPEGPHYLAIPTEKAKQFKNGLQAIPDNQRLQWRRYTVKAGDSLLKIAKRNRTQVALISEANKLTSTVIRIGQPLLIPVPAKDAESYSLTAGQRQIAKQSKPSNGQQKRQYVVQSGDSFWTIARRYGVSVKELARWNNLSPKKPLQINQTLSVWVASKTPDKVVRKVRYKVRSGDSLSLIADKFDIDVSEIKDWNTLDARYIHPGQQLTLYVDIARANN